MCKIFRLFLVATLMVSLSFVVSGCAQKKVATKPGDSGVSSSDSDQYGGMASAEESLDSTSRSFSSNGRTSGPFVPVYFDFDKFNIRTDQISRIRKNASVLKNDSRIKIRIEGNCDERGTDEYNRALGQRRALSAQKYLVNLGIDQNRLKTISYGEDKPVAHGSNEAAWAKNRRDDFVIIGR